MRSPPLWPLAVSLLCFCWRANAKVLNPPYFNLAAGRRVTSTATCGEGPQGEPLRELFCDLTGATQHYPGGRYYYETNTADEGGPGDGDGKLVLRRARRHETTTPGDNSSIIRETREDQTSYAKVHFLQGGQNCEYCDAQVDDQHHTPDFMVDGTQRRWQSPPLSRGMHFNAVNITIHFEQEFHVAYVFIKMANSPRPAVWVLERSVDNGLTYQPWQYFAESPAQCSKLFGEDTIYGIQEDTTVVCTSKYSQIVPLEDGEITVSLVNERPGGMNFTHNEQLQQWTRATDVRIRLLKTKTLQGHLMDIQRKDPSIIRRYFYAIREIEMGGRCVCHGHAETCDAVQESLPNRLYCRCEHNTCGEQCQECCPGFVQKRWQPVREGIEFVCEPCNCHGHTADCVYDESVDGQSLSLDVHGRYSGGGVCKGCRDHTEGINCEKCVFGYFHPEGRLVNATDACEQCGHCDPYYHTGDCEDVTGHCFCKSRFLGPDCRACASGYYDYPQCKPCDCHVNGSIGEVCQPDKSGQCPCKENYGGTFCNKCAPMYYSFPDCKQCECVSEGSVNNVCELESGKCTCKANYGGLDCSRCKEGYYNFPVCSLCDCDPTGSEASICNATSGVCLCGSGYSGNRCDVCNVTYWGYPNCQKCECDLRGSENEYCDEKSGNCKCKPNFTGKNCDRCAAGYYNFPDCAACNCVQPGSIGLTCNRQGRCKCKSNFDGIKCDRCKENFFNYPICEECNCEPAGVPVTFGGCDRVAPGQLCECKPRVQGRICNQCKPTFWNLQYNNQLGCDDCDCHKDGTMSELNLCDASSGQCRCKLHAGGRQCNQCRTGYFSLQTHNAFGCGACACDPGGSLGHTCDPRTGQCYCKARVNNRDCSAPLKTNYFPTLWHLKYELEDGVSPDGATVRYASDESKFPNFSMMGFVVFSPIQDEIILHITAPKRSLYQILLSYAHPLPEPLDVDIQLRPHQVRSEDLSEQLVTAHLAPTQQPTTVLITDQRTGKPFSFVLEGQWKLHIKTKKRLFADFAVLLPQAYFSPTNVLKVRVERPCEALDVDEATCREFTYPEIPHSHSVVEDMKLLNEEGEEEKPKEFEGLPVKFGPTARLFGNKTLVIDVKPEAAGNHVLVVHYYNPEKNFYPAVVRSAGGANISREGDIKFHHCPYSAPCRELVTSEGFPVYFSIPDHGAMFEIMPIDEVDLAVTSVTAVPADDWNDDYLKPQGKCVRDEGRCFRSDFPAPMDFDMFEFESEPNANISGPIEFDSDPLPVDPRPVFVTLDEDLSNVTLIGSVDRPDYYIFIVHYHQPQQVTVDAHVVLLNEQTYREKTGKPQVDGDGMPVDLSNAYVMGGFCPSVSSCRAVVKQKGDNAMSFYIHKDFVLRLKLKPGSTGPLHLDYVVAVPHRLFQPDILHEQPYLDRSAEYFEKCARDNFNIDLADTGFCRGAVFSITADFNDGALPCDCSHLGTTSYICAEFGGQCDCKDNIIGRRCDQCRPGYYGFPNCKPCNCAPYQKCDSRTGQCYCALHIVGQTCDRCATSAFGFDQLIGCQLCGCHPDGSADGNLDCNQLSGQCVCKENVGGRRCDRCLPGFYGFKYCYPCSCDAGGSTPEICDQATAQCICKENVRSDLNHQTCSLCKYGTFDLQASNPKGCTDCFCFGTTNQCRGSNFNKLEIMEMADWQASNVADVELYNSPAMVELRVLGEKVDDSEGIYLTAPSQYLGKQLYSYGGKLQYEVTATPKEGFEESFESQIRPDVVLKGSNLTLEYFMPSQPTNLMEPLQVVVTFLPANWMLPDGSPVTREQLMMALVHVTQLKIKVSYYTQTLKASLKSVRLDSADASVATAEQYAATSVEMCHCPPPYRGSSCEECAEGYFRVQSGPYLGSCVPCQCHAHSMKCDVNTGICIDCMNHTTGAHCDQCAVGHFGDPSRGTPWDCQQCPCPHHKSNFGLSCEVSREGILLSCVCQQGYTGNRCDRCEPGWFGQPHLLDGQCQVCQCNQNNDLSLEGSCDPMLGVCRNCANHTIGDACQDCEPWFYGDAVAAKNCSECLCDQCGSNFCDHRDGKCLCKPNVQGELCDSCVLDAWGFDQCRGCQMCECGAAAVSSQCDPASGQCDCMPGAGGMHCARCQNGYWDYQESGCKKCDCDADLSEGTVCDVFTGQCQCMEGATGPRCDTCVDGYLRVPGKGCLFCDECVHVLVGDLEMLQFHINGAMVDLANISLAYFTGKRLKAIEERMADFAPLVKRLPSLNSNEALESLNMKAKILATAVGDVKAKAQRSLNDSVSTLARTDKLLSNAKDAQMTVREHTRDLFGTIETIQKLATGIGQESPNSIRREQLMELDTTTLGRIKEVDLGEMDRKVKMELDAAKQDLDDVRSVLNDDVALQEDIRAVEDGLSDVHNKTRDLNGVISQAVSRRSQAEAAIDGVPLNPVTDIYHRIEAQKNKSEVLLKDARQFVADSIKLQEFRGDCTKSIIENSTLVNGSLAELVLKKEHLVEQLPSLTTLRHESARHANQLEHEARSLDGRFATSRDSSRLAVQASSVYLDVTELLRKALENARNASEDANTADDLCEGVQVRAKESRTLSVGLGRKSSANRAAVVNDLQKNLASAKSNLKSAETILGEQKVNVAKTDRRIAEMDNDKFDEKTNRIYGESDEILKEAQRTKTRADTLLAQVPEIEEQSTLKSQQSSTLARDQKSTQEQIQKLKDMIPSVLANLSRLQETEQSRRQLWDSVESKFDELRRKVEVARDIANRIKIGVQTHGNASLQVSNPPRIRRSAAYTHIGLYFKAKGPDGLMMWLGNPQGTRSSQLIPSEDYLALKLENWQPVLVFDFGSGPAVIKNPAVVNDNKWHLAEIERTGKSGVLTIKTQDGEDRVAQGSSAGSASVLNLHPDVSRMYIAGVPADVKVASPVTVPGFTGVIEDVEFHGVPVGLWNFAKDGQAATYGHSARTELMPKLGEETGVSFNGEGFMIVPRGGWNPRKNARIEFSFVTFAKEGVLFFIGKERDFMSVELMEGHIVLRYDLGAGPTMVTSHGSYNDGRRHKVTAERDGKHGKITLDTDQISESTAAGEMFELAVSDELYIGGLPRGEEHRHVTGRGFNGCLFNLMLDGTAINLYENQARVGVKQGCPTQIIRTISLDAPSGGRFVFENNRMAPQSTELTFKLKTRQLNGFIFVLDYPKRTSRDRVLTGHLANGQLVIASKIEDGVTQLVAHGQSALADGEWHYVTVKLNSTSIQFLLDDILNEVQPFSGTIPAPAEMAELQFGSLPEQLRTAVDGQMTGNGQPFIGCIGDVTLNGDFLQFNTATRAGLFSLTGCPLDFESSLPAEWTGVTDPNSIQPPPVNPAAESGSQVGSGGVEGNVVTELTEGDGEASASAAPLTDSCVLKREPIGPREDSRGHRFGSGKESRLEFHKLPTTIDTKANFSLKFRAVGSDGVLLFAANEERTDYLALLLKEGKIVYRFNSGRGVGDISSQRSYLDGEWHSVLAGREGRHGWLVIDEESIGSVDSPQGTSSIDTSPPLFVGGLPSNDLKIPKTKDIILDVTPVFSGCLRGLKLNGEPFGAAESKHGVVPCTQHFEEGVSFGKNGGYAVIDPEYRVGSSFSFEMEIKPRVQTAVLLAIGSPDPAGDYLILQMISGRVEFVVNNGGGPEVLTFNLSSPAEFCNGHWHHIKVYKAKNLMTLSVDRSNKVHVAKRRGVETDTKDPLYVAGVPGDYVNAGLKTREPFVGCMRLISLGKRPRLKKDIRTEDLATFGDVNTGQNACPVN